jgi:small GTP-binding protein
MKKKNLNFKVITTGDGGVGKTTFLKRYSTNRFEEDTKITIGADFFSKTIELEEYSINMIIWDFTGQERFRFILDSYAEGAKGAFFMVDLNNILRSLKSMGRWMKIIKRYEDIPVLLVGTKSDLIERDPQSYNLHKDLISQIREKYKFIDFFTTSSKSGENVNEAVENLINHILVNAGLKSEKN